MDVHEEVARLRDMRDWELQMKEYYELMKENREAQERRVFDYMRETRIDGIKVDGKNFVPVETDYSVIQDRTEFVAWAEKNAPELITTVEKKGELHKLVRSRIDNGEGLPPGIGHRVDQGISMRQG